MLFICNIHKHFFKPVRFFKANDTAVIFDAENDPVAI